MNGFIEKYQKEYMHEINNYRVEVEDLRKLGISNRVLASEVYLRKLYGDEILISHNSYEVDEKSKRKIVKVEVSEMEKIQGLKNIDEEIELSEFDKNFEMISKE